MLNCLICDTPNFIEGNSEVGGNWLKCQCERCGTFHISRELLEDLPSEKQQSDFAQWVQVASHHLRQQSLFTDKAILLTPDHFAMLKNIKPPKFPLEQANNIILWYGNVGQKTQGKRIYSMTGPSMIAIAGARDSHCVEYILELQRDQGLLKWASNKGHYLTSKGWEHYEDLKRGTLVSKSAFMAMKFNEPKLESIYTNHFRNAVKATGFELQTVIGRAGPINDHIMIDIRLARFVVADLTHHNNGAYWEAGFAEGLGKPVFYTCEKSVFSSESTHFDVNHHHTILWDIEKPKEAADNLKALIRNTLPGEAKMLDEQP